MNIQDIKKIKAELKSFEEILNDAEKRCNWEFKEMKSRKDSYYDKIEKIFIDGTSESSTLKSSFKVMKYKIGKILG